MSGPVYRWRVTHPERGAVEVIGPRKYEAVLAAAKLWGVPWTSVARGCYFERLEEVAGLGLNTTLDEWERDTQKEERKW